ncbi:glucose-6-phosphate dehydrogenase [Rhodopila sp.]|uniref:glucose-6-phosphate dehydrogenase n=1 Tax=Rhodopila sp. TaxID=2480087 RepID=UPI003D1049BB
MTGSSSLASSGGKSPGADTSSHQFDQPAAGVKQAPPCTLVIFGAGGDLTKRLLMPALYNLSGGKLLPDRFSIIGVDRVQQGDDAWRHTLTETMQSFTKDKTAEFYTPKLDDAAWGWVSSRLHYLSGDFSQDETFANIGKAIGDGSAVFYLAVAARFFGTVVDGLGKAGLLKQSDSMFRRVVIEKPFGADLPSAQALNARILKQADESQFYRIDHFLGKETVQSIMAVRFANGMFEPMWRREYIDHVEITAAETVGVEQRGAFYEPTGALRDMVPNHLFTLLCMAAMEPPNSFDAEDVRTERAKLVQAIRPLRPDEAVRGQYTAGEELAAAVPAYRQEPHVAPDSHTETYVALKLSIENWRWAGVPFYLRTGKRMAGRQTEISIHYKPAPYRIFSGTPVDATTSNVVRLLIDPDQGIDTELDAKVPGPQMRLGRVKTSLRYKTFFEEPPNVGYETLLYDCMMGDTILFQRADNIEASWRVVQPLLEAWGRGEGEVESYTAGSQGPAGADALLQHDGDAWSRLSD